MTRTPLVPLMTLSLFALCGCDRADGSLEDQLEALTIEATDADGLPLEFEDEARNAAGTLGVTGTAADPLLHLSRDEGDLEVALHLPGGSELAWLDGATVTLSLPPDEAWDRWTARPLIIADADGPALVAQLVGHAPDASDEVFGSAFVRYGAEQGYDERGTREFHTRSVVVQTDEGPLEVLPGEVHGIRVGGADWRFVLIAAYEVDEPSGSWDAAAKCIGPPDALSFEMVRVAAADDGESQLLRPDDAAPAIGPGCGI
jgi:hypothetical protein